MKTRILIVGDGWKTLGRSNFFEWPFSELPQRNNTISKELIPKINWVADDCDNLYECYSNYLVVQSINYHLDECTRKKVIEILIEI